MKRLLLSALGIMMSLMVAYAQIMLFVIGMLIFSTIIAGLWLSRKELFG